MVEEGQFRGDLLARLGHVVEIPSLRDRPEDVPLLVAHFVELCGHASAGKSFSPEAMTVLERQEWKFYVRQLRQVVEQMMYLVDHDVITSRDLPDFARGTNDPPPGVEVENPPRARAAGPPRPLKEVVEQIEKERILRALEFTNGNRREAIKLLGTSSYTFYKRLEQFGLHEKRS